MLLLSSLICGPVVNGLEAAHEMDICSEIFLHASCQFLFCMTVNYPITDGLKNDTFGSLQLSPSFYLTFTPIVIKKYE